MRRWHEEVPVMLRRQKNVLAARRRNRWWWGDRESDPLGKFRKSNPYVDHGCRCSWCRPEILRRRANAKREAIRDGLDHYFDLRWFPDEWDDDDAYLDAFFLGIDFNTE